MVKTEYNYQIKRIYHRRLKKSIGGWLKNPETLKVLCLPGAEAREILEVYDRLDIPRKNIVGVEIDPDCVKRLTNLNLGIRIFSGDVADYLKTTNDKFDVISLDFPQTPSFDTLWPILDISERQLLKSGRSILHTNLYASRISQFVLRSLPILAEYKEEKTEIIREGKPVPVTHVSSSWKTGTSLDLEKYIHDLRGLKDHGITTFIAQALQGETDFLKILSKIKVDEGDKIIEGNVIPVVNGNPEHTAIPHPDQTLTSHFVNCFYLQQRPYFIQGVDRFSYVSDDSSLLMSDVFFVTDFSDVFQRAGKYFLGYGKANNGSLYYNMECKKNPFKVSVREFGKCIEEWGRGNRTARSLLLPSNQPEREEINPTEVLTRERAVQLIKSGWTLEMFEERYKDVTPARIAAYKAHITMGTYDKEKELTEADKKEESPLNEVKLKRGVLIYDSNPIRLRKNIERIDFRDNSIDLTSILEGSEQSPGLLKKRKTYDLYILNTMDDNFRRAFSDLALKFCESRYLLNVFLIGDPNSALVDAQAAKELGAKIKVNGFETENGYLPSGRKLVLEEMMI